VLLCRGKERTLPLALDKHESGDPRIHFLAAAVPVASGMPRTKASTAVRGSSYFESERVGAFADAILAIFATVAAVPVSIVPP
jgi:hypothetical protein